MKQAPRPNRWPRAVQPAVDKQHELESSSHPDHQRNADMIRRTAIALFPLLALVACGGATKAVEQRPATFIPPPSAKQATGLDRVMGKDARALVSLFGPAQQDVREENARKLQFAGSNCVLDAYLYPPSKGKEPVVTYLSARVPDGRDADKASCVSSLARK